ncbi:hypothetical protein JCM5350_006484 [Sporobolomyces pararoseus]
MMQLSFRLDAFAAVLLLLLVAGRVQSSSLPPRALDSIPELEDDDLRKREMIILVHAVCGFLAFQVFAPIAVVIASIGRSWGDTWFKIHYRVQLFVVVPLAIFSVGLGASATTYDVQNVMDKHKVLGFVLVGLLALQLLLGLWAHLAQKIERDAAPEGKIVEEKRRSANWLHIFLGIVLLSLGGLQVTWGLGEWNQSVGTIPTWITVVHWIIAGVPVVIVTPFVLVRGALRMRRGQTFAQAFFDRRPASGPYVPPRKLFLGSSTYRSIGQDEEKDDEEQDRLIGETKWVGATTREEYEASLSNTHRNSTTSTYLSNTRNRNSTTSTYDTNDYLFDAQSEEQASIPSKRGSADDSVMPTLAPSPSIYPPTPSIGTPYIDPAIPTSSMSPLTLPIFSPPPPPILSPRLAFMPFSGSAVVNHSSPSTVAASPSTPRVSTLPSIRSNLSNSHEHQVVVVPTPSPPTSSPRPVSISSSAAAICGGESVEEVTSVPVSNSRVVRHSSMSGEIVGKAKESGEGQTPSLEITLEEEDETTPTVSDHNFEEEGSDVRGDDESTRLMDELERELTILSTHSRHRIPDRFDGVEGGMEGAATGEREIDLARTKSGEWIGGAKRNSQQQ